MKSNLVQFINEWFPKTEQWNNIRKFILDSGIQLTDDINPKWLTGYTNIGRNCKPHHKDDYIRYMEESMFVLHDIVHQIFTLNVDPNITEDEYVKRQIFGELFTFYLTEYIIPKQLMHKHRNYFYEERDCFNLMDNILKDIPTLRPNIIDWMWRVFIEDEDLKNTDVLFEWRALKKYRKMFKEDLENSKKNYKFVKELGLKSYCIVGETSQNHLDFFESVKCGAVKNIKREFNLTLPKEWI